MVKTPNTVAKAFAPELVAMITQYYEDNIPFNKLLGLKVASILPEQVTASIVMRRELVGHRPSHRIHGGVISAGIDVTGSLAVMAAISARHIDESHAQLVERFSKIGTIDLHIDYLRPGHGDHFLFRAEVLRLGSRVATARTDFLAADGKLLATGTTAYIVS